ncbi:quinone oxidoreductase family protein [Jonesia quinghaiensis]|uniref:quinone oxidoreductase family protein n=1 Tax=Jonesia quinghaiensis TaxID=262806 RepID=UPI0003FD3A1B|nr:quinone oxidoreductase [Jonesia quinghaiensis]
MRAAQVTSFHPDRPVAGLSLNEVDPPHAPEHWSVVDVHVAALNHHDVWSLKGVGLSPDALPMTLGTDAAGVTADGRRVMVHAVVGGDGHGVGPQERRSILSEKYAGTLAEQVIVPTANLVDVPATMSLETAACLPTAWLTAYSLVFRGAQLTPGQSVLIQGAGGGVSSAAMLLALAAGITVHVTSRDPAKRERAAQYGAQAWEPGARLPHRVDAVIETVGKATWGHSVRSLRPGGVIAIAGATTGDPDVAELTRVFFQELRIQGVTMGTREDLAALAQFVATRDIQVPIDSRFPLAEVDQAIARLAGGEHYGKILLDMRGGHAAA